MGQQLLLGPLEGGAFRRVAVTGIHRSKVDVQVAARGQHATLAVQPLDGGGEAAGGGDADASGAGGAGAAPGGSASGEPLLPARGDSAGCLHAWMARSVGAGGTPPLAIRGPASLPLSSLTAQLAGSAGGALPPSAAGSSPQLASMGSGAAAPRPRKVRPRCERAAAVAPACAEQTQLLAVRGSAKRSLPRCLPTASSSVCPSVGCRHAALPLCRHAALPPCRELCCWTPAWPPRPAPASRLFWCCWAAAGPRAACSQVGAHRWWVGAAPPAARPPRRQLASLRHRLPARARQDVAALAGGWRLV
jgi:hypothetical protein